VAENVLTHGTGALNIDACRVPHITVPGGQATNPHLRANIKTGEGSADNALFPRHAGDSLTPTDPLGRWPANLILSGEPEVLAGFPQTSSGQLNAGHKQGSGVTSFQHMNDGNVVLRDYGGDSGSAARFFYCAKASRSEREANLDGHDRRQQDPSRHDGYPGGDNPRNRGAAARANHHPTVKPLALMRYLVRLVTRPGGLVLDPFMGSGTTGVAADAEGFRFIGSDLNVEYVGLAQGRRTTAQLRLAGL